MMKLRGLYLLMTVLFLSSTVFAQTQLNDDVKWTRIEDSKDQISILFPSGYLVDNEERKSLIITSFPKFVEFRERPDVKGFHKSVTMSLSVCQLMQAPIAKQYLWYFVDSDTPKDKYQEFQLGDVLGRRTVYEKDDFLAINIVFAVKSRIYTISASAKKEDREIYEQFVMSLKIGGQLLFKAQTPKTTNAEPVIALSTLRTSPEVLEALNQKPDKDPAKAEKITDGLQAADKDDERKLSRPLVILRSPYPGFTLTAGVHRTSGTVKLKVTFLASGKIGKIIILTDLPDGLTESSIKAVRDTKFIPAEIDGKKVDTTSIRTYNFSFAK